MNRCVAGTCPDADGDGSRAAACGGSDCDDTDPDRYPGNREVCDASDVDEDCDPLTFGFRDGDGDTHPDARCCNVDTSSARHCGDDCNDMQPSIYSGLVEACDSLDNDCDDATDEGVLRTFFVDSDGDGFGDETMPTVMACTPPVLHSEMGRDCNDTRNDVSPVSPEICDLDPMDDEDCDGTVNEDCSCVGSGSRQCTLPGRCAAGVERCAAGSWGACSITGIAEICNAEDDDCDGRVDESTLVTCYDDSDDDTYPEAAAMPLAVCPDSTRAPVGGCPFGLTNRVPGADANDCDDADDAIHPSATELCDAARADEDCDRVANPPSLCACSGVERRSCVAMGVCAMGVETCATGAWGPCSVLPGTESCNMADDDCDGRIDETATIVCYTDGDNDTYSPGGGPMNVCPVPGRIDVGGCPITLTNRSPAAGTDCDDTRSVAYPGAPESCTGAFDDDCDMMVNEGCMCTVDDMRPCALPGVCGLGTERCALPGPAWVCDRSPAAESCNAADDDCDGRTDEGVLARCWADGDGDFYAPTGASYTDVCGACPANTTNRDPGIVAMADCDDATASRHPGATELCNRLDDDCSSGGGVAVAEDADSDGYAPSAAPCIGGPLPRTDCNDLDVSINTAGIEVCGGADENCNGMIDEEPAASAACGAAHGTAECVAGACAVISCSPGWADCDRSYGGGCEADLVSGAGSCGECGVTCPFGGTCTQGECPAILDVAVGGAHACALVGSPGIVLCWGDNTYGQLGNGTTTTSATPVQVTGLTNATAITAGADHTCARRIDGTVACWGRDDQGQIGDGTAGGGSRTSPVTVVGPGAVVQLSGIVEVTAGGAHTCARQGAAAFCWGDNDEGQLGIGSSTGDFARPQAIVGGPGSLSVIAAGDGHTCSVGSSGGAYCWGRNSSGQLGDGTTTERTSPTAIAAATSATHIAMGTSHTCMRTSLGIQCWGDNAHGQLGAVGAGSLTPQAVAFAPSFVPTDVYAGADHSCARRASDRSLWCWGRSPGNGLAADATAPTVLAQLEDAHAVVSTGDTMDGGGGSTCVLRATGALACWGSNGSGQLGDGTMTTSMAPVLVRSLAAPMTSVSTAQGATCARRASGEISCWGSATYGKLGNNSNVGSEAYPIGHWSLENAGAVGLGAAHACARSASGSVSCWGRGDLFGSLGDGTVTDSWTSVLVSGLSTVSSIGIGYSHGCAVRTTGDVLCWGRNDQGQIGDGTTTQRNTPVPVTLSNVSEVALGTLHTCARTASGSVFCWGDDSAGQLGDDATLLDQTLPVQVSGIGSAVEIVAGEMHSCARLATGEVRCWGQGGSGRLGNGSTVDAPVPVVVSGGVTDFVDLHAGSRHTCGVRATGAVMCWGADGTGQLGDGVTLMDRPTPTAVMGVSDAVRIGPGPSANHVCVVRTNGSLACWGDNFQYWIGDGSMTTRPTAVGVVGLPERTGRHHPPAMAPRSRGDASRAPRSVADETTTVDPGLTPRALCLRG